MGLWLEQQLVQGVASFRGQFGYFDGSALQPFVPVLKNMTASGGVLRLVIGANPGDLPSVEQLVSLLPLLEGRADNALSVVAFSGGALFHPKALHIQRADGSSVAYVGSANFTGKGLGHSVEAGLIVDGPECREVLSEVAAAIDRWGDSEEDGVFRIRTEGDIAELKDAGLAATREEQLEQRAQRGYGGGSTARGTRPVGWRPPATRPRPTPATDAVGVEPQADQTEPTEGTTAAQVAGVAPRGFWKVLSKNDTSLTSSPGQIIIPIRFREVFEPLRQTGGGTTERSGRQWERTLRVVFKDGTWTGTAPEARVIVYEPQAGHPRPNTECRFTFHHREILERLSPDDVLVFEPQIPEPWLVTLVKAGSTGATAIIGQPPRRFGPLV